MPSEPYKRRMTQNVFSLMNVFTMRAILKEYKKHDAIAPEKYH